MRVDELAEVLAIDFDALDHGGIPELNPNWRWANQHKAVLSTCSSLITITGTGRSKVVQFSHFSVKEYLTLDRLAHSSRDISRYHIVLEPAHTILTQACLGVLLRLDEHVNADNVSNIPLAEYAARHWIDHAQFEDVASRIRNVMEYFFDGDKPHWRAWCRVQVIDISWEGFTAGMTGEACEALPLYYASLGGFYNLAKHLVIEHPEQINARGGRSISPLVAALRGKHFQIAELLHRNGANVDVLGTWKDTALIVACGTGVLDITQWLLNHGADVNVRGIQLYGPLHEAIDYGHFQVVQMLIEHNADIHNLTGTSTESLRCTWQHVLMFMVIKLILCRRYWTMVQILMHRMIIIPLHSITHPGGNQFLIRLNGGLSKVRGCCSRMVQL